MNKVITTALMAAMLASTAAEALAQDAPRGRAGPREHSQGSPEASPPQAEERPYEGRRAGRAGIIRRDEPRPAPQVSPPPAPPQARQAPAAPRAPSADPRYGGRHDWNDRDRRDHDRGDRDRDRDRRDRDWDDRRRDDDRRGGDPRWNGGHGWRPDSDRNRPRYDRRYYPPVYPVPHRYRSAPYRPPAGWFTFGWGFGDTLPRGWYGPEYRIFDWWAYGLPQPPLGYDWIRVGDDALLVDNFTGRVVQVAYNLFW